MKPIDTKGWFKPMRAIARTMGKRRWHLMCTGRIRTHIHGVGIACPLTQAAHDGTGRPLLDTMYWHHAGQQLGLTDVMSNTIADAADNPAHPCRRVRSILRRAARLHGKAAQ